MKFPTLPVILGFHLFICFTLVPTSEGATNLENPVPSSINRWVVRVKRDAALASASKRFSKEIMVLKRTREEKKCGEPEKASATFSCPKESPKCSINVEASASTSSTVTVGGSGNVGWVKLGLEITIGYSWTRSASFSNSYNTEISPGQSGYVVFAPTYRVTTGMAKFYDGSISSRNYKPSKDTEIVLREPVTGLGGTLAGTIGAIIYNTDEGPPNNPHFPIHCPGDVITEFKTGYTRYGKDCQSTCSNTGTNYYWCYEYITTGDFDIKVYKWEYCATGSRTIYGEKCKGSCGEHGYSYYWCWTNDSWDYCAPENL